MARHPPLHSIGLTSLLGIGTGVLAVFMILPIARRPGVYNAGGERAPGAAGPGGGEDVTPSGESGHGARSR